MSAVDLSAYTKVPLLGGGTDLLEEGCLVAAVHDTVTVLLGVHHLVVDQDVEDAGVTSHGGRSYLSARQLATDQVNHELGVLAITSRIAELDLHCRRAALVDHFSADRSSHLHF